MPKLRPPQGRQAAAVAAEPETELEDQVVATEENDVPEPQEDPTVALKQQIEALRKSEREAIERAEAERQKAADAMKRAEERDAEVNQLRQDTVTSQAEAIEAALAAAQAEAESAQRDLESAAQLGDFKAQAEAQRKLSRAEAKMLRLEDGKEALERQAKEAPKPEPRQSQAQPDPLESINLPPLAKTWLRNHPEYLYDGRKNAKIQALHWDVVDEGHQPYSQEYFATLEQKLGLRAPPARQGAFEEDDEMDDAAPSRKTNVSAPPSREVPSSSGTRQDGRIRLTLAQKEAAKIAGISEAEYAKQVERLRQEKSSGNYGGAP